MSCEPYNDNIAGKGFKSMFSNLGQHSYNSMGNTIQFSFFFICRTLNDLSCQEFMNEVRYWWGDRPSWYGQERATPDSPVVAACCGILEDWAEPHVKEKCFLGETRNQVFGQIKMYKSF